MAIPLFSKMFDFFDEVSTHIQVQELIYSVFDDKKPKWAEIDEDEVLRLLAEVEQLQHTTFSRLSRDDVSAFRNEFTEELNRRAKLKAENHLLMTELSVLEASRRSLAVEAAAEPDSKRDRAAPQSESDVNRNPAEGDNAEQLHDDGANSSFANIDALRENETRLRAVVSRRERSVAALRSRIEAELTRERELTRSIAELRQPASLQKQRVASACRSMLRTLASLSGVRDALPDDGARELLQLLFANDVRVSFAFESGAVPASLPLNASAKEVERWAELQKNANWQTRIVAVEPEPADPSSHLAAVACERQFAPLPTWIIRIDEALRADLGW